MNEFVTVKRLFDTTIKNIVLNELEWKKYLDFAARIWKHKYDTQIFIYGQRPDATFIANKDVWQEKIHRSINNVSKAIKIFDTTKSKITMEYLFDISDTNGPEKTLPKLWRVNEEYSKTLTDKINKKLNQDYNSFNEAIIQISKKYVEIVLDSYLEKESNQISMFDQNRSTENQIFKTIFENSVAYYVAKRCDCKLNKEFVFDGIEVLGQNRTMFLKLCEAVNSTSNLILKMIEVELINIIKQNLKERGNRNGDIIRGERRGAVSQNRDGGERSSNREIRTDEDGLYTREISEGVYRDVHKRNFEQHNETRERGSMGSSEYADSEETGTGSDKESNGHIRSIPPQGNADERSRGNSIAGNNIQRTIEDKKEPEQISNVIKLRRREKITIPIKMV